MIREIRASKPPATAVNVPIRNNVVDFWLCCTKVSSIIAGKWANVAPPSTAMPIGSGPKPDHNCGVITHLYPLSNAAIGLDT